MAEADFESSVFLNCPFDEEFEPTMQAMLFCIVFMGFTPRIATERSDSGETRLSKIVELISKSKFSIHDLSRSKSKIAGDLARHNMPFELGIDYGCKKFHTGRADKTILVLDEASYRYQASISDLSGCDIQTHDGDYQKAVRAVRTWLVSEANAQPIGAKLILDRWADFQEWYFETQLASGSSEEDIYAYPTSEMLTFMHRWMAEGQPL